MAIRLRVGVSSCFLHADPQRALFKGKTLVYAEESMLSWLMSEGVFPVLMPRAVAPLTARALVEDVDALVLQGGSDMSPVHYGEEPLRPEWAGDHARDLYEMELVRIALELHRPILGCCRGAQVLNVALGGSLWQDLATMHPERRTHRDWEIYDKLSHEVDLVPGSWFARCYGRSGGGRGLINSVHHQGIKDLGRNLVVEGKAVDDGVVEAIRYVGADRDGNRAFAIGVQWHPEFMYGTTLEPGALEPSTLLRAFLAEVEARLSPTARAPVAKGATT